MSGQKHQEICKNCQSTLSGTYCATCGYPKTLPRIDRKYLLSEISSVLNFDKGILFTIKELLIRPGKNVRDFINRDRNRLVKPVIFLILCSLAYTIAEQFLHFEDEYENAYGFGESATSDIFGWIQKNYGYANILMAVFIALWIKIFFRKYDYNFFEILILLCFVMGMGMLIYTVFGIAESLTGTKLLQAGSLLAFVYVSWAIGLFFDKKKKMNYVKGFISYILGMISFYTGAVVLGYAIDMLA